MNTPTFTLRIPPELRRTLEVQAAADGRSLANYVTLILSRHVAGTPTRHPDSIAPTGRDPASPRSATRALAATNLAAARSAPSTPAGRARH